MNYKNLLSTIKNATTSVNEADILVPSNKQLYEIDLNTREIKGPETLSVQSEHYAETVYFIVDRYYDNMDLAQTNCVVQYVTDVGNYVYAVPFCDVTTYIGGLSENDTSPKMIIPWSISASATKNAGTVKYFLRFYLIDKKTLENDVVEFSYSLSTLPAQAKILKTLANEDFTTEDDQLQAQIPERYLEIINELTQITDNATIYWIEADTLV